MQDADGVVPSSKNVYRDREIQKLLTQRLHSASEHLRLFQGTPEARHVAKREYEQALRQFTEFATKGTVPDDLKDVQC